MSKKDEIRLSPKHGVNPSMSVCIVCGLEDGTIVLPGLLPGDQEAPRRAVWSAEPCDQCKEWMQKGVIFVSCRDDSDPKNPYRTGALCVIADAGVRRMPFPDEEKERILKQRVCFMSDEAWDKIGMPRENINPTTEKNDGSDD